MANYYRNNPIITSSESVKGQNRDDQTPSGQPLETRFAKIPEQPSPPPESRNYRIVGGSAKSSGSQCSGELRAKVRARRGVSSDSLAYEKLLGITRALTSCSSPQQLFEKVIDAALDVTGAARGFLFLLGPDSLDPNCSLAGLRVAASRGLSQGDLGTVEFRASRSAIMKAVRTGETACWDGGIGGDWSSHSLEVIGSRSILCEPLKVDERVLGVLYLDSALCSHFNEDHERLLPGLAAQAAICLENSRLQYEREAALEREFSERVRTKELEVYQETLSSFMAIASHDLKSPLSVMRTGIALLKRDLPTETKEKVTRFLENAVDKASRLISGYLDIQQLESGQKLKLRYERISLLDLLREEKDFAMNLVMEQNQGDLELLLQISPKSNMVVDRERFSQIMSNLLSNAVKYSPEGGSITVTHTDDSQEHRICVSDQGIGMSEDGVKRLFGRFVRLETDRSIRGTGLGLFVVRRLVEAHGGTVSVNSEEGVGTTFVLTFPKQVADKGELV